jgi:hypothetical protein
MGFGLMFVRLKDPEMLDADRVGLAEFLASQGLTSSDETGELVRISDGEALAFDGRWTDLHLDSLTQEEPVTGGIDHATLTHTVWVNTPEELAHALGASFSDFTDFRDRALGNS